MWFLKQRIGGTCGWFFGFFHLSFSYIRTTASAPCIHLFCTGPAVTKVTAWYLIAWGMTRQRSRHFTHQLFSTSKISILGWKTYIISRTWQRPNIKTSQTSQMFPIMQRISESNVSRLSLPLLMGRNACDDVGGAINLGPFTEPASSGR